MVSLTQIVRTLFGGKGQTRDIPFPIELIDGDERRREFEEDYLRLVKRCGPNAMTATFMRYLEEQVFEEFKKTNPEKPLPKRELLGYNNTSRVVIRFVENGWADYFLLSKDPKGKTFYVSTCWDGSLYIAQNDGGNANTQPVEILIKRPSEDLLKFTLRLHDELKKESTLIPPERIREVFAEIDKRYE